MLGYRFQLCSRKGMKSSWGAKTPVALVTLVLIQLFLHCAAMASSVTASTRRTRPPHPWRMYVSPVGKETNSGLTPERPLRDIQHAQMLVRKWISQGMNRDIVVYLESGTYWISEPLKFDERDTGNHGHVVIWRNYPGASPVLDGGTLITRWTRDENNAWSASANKLTFLQLYGPYGRIDPAKTPTFRGQLYSVPKSDTVQVKVPDDLLEHWQIKPLEGVQLVVQDTWRQFRYRIESISPSEDGYRWVVAKAPSGTVNPDAGEGFVCCDPDGTNPVAESRHPITSGRSPVYMEYAEQFMTPNSFWLNRASSKVTWIAPAGLNPNRVQVTAPKIETLLTIDGASNLVFYGIQFAHTTWLGPAESGNMERQGGLRAEPQAAGFTSGGWPIWYVNPGAVVVQNSSHVTFERDWFRDLGANGIVLGVATRDITIADSTFRSISDSGIFVGSTQDPTLPFNKENVNTRIERDLFDHIGVDYVGGAAITGTYPNGLFVEHNLIENVANVGINLGYINNLPPDLVTSMRNVQIIDNRIDRTCLVAADCGAIHTKTNFYYSTAPGHAVPISTIRGNYITNVHINPYYIGAPPVKAIYLDNHTNGLLVAHNEWKLVDAAWGKPNHGHSDFVQNEIDDPRVLRDAGLPPINDCLKTLDLYKESIGVDDASRDNSGSMESTESEATKSACAAGKTVQSCALRRMQGN